MNKGIALLGVAVALLLSSEKIRAEDKEPLAIIALGGATEWGFPERKFSFGPSASVEFSAIKDWLEIEVGGARLFRRGRSEWEAEIVFRKPFTLSDTAEFMVGLGRYGLTQKAKARSLAPHMCLISCSGRGLTENLAGLWSPATLPAKAMKNRLL